MKIKNNIVIVICGPTACMKTSTSIKLARVINTTCKYNVEIINFDSLLFYKELNIGTAKPTEIEMEGIRHHLINISSINNNFNSADFVKIAVPLINDLHQKKTIAILVGGSAFYLRALLKGMYSSTHADTNLLNFIQRKYQAEGIEYFREELKQKDSESFINLHPNDHYRILRAFEYFEVTKQKLSEQKKLFEENNPYDLGNTLHPSWNKYICYLDIPKILHQKIIKSRTEKMEQSGLVHEVKNLLAQGFSGEEKALQSIGYKETLDYLTGILQTREDYLERITISTRQLAKAQRTFFKKFININSYNPIQESDQITRDILDFIHLK